MIDIFCFFGLRVNACSPQTPNPAVVKVFLHASESASCVCGTVKPCACVVGARTSSRFL
jgi:hypothetical protein